MRAMWLLCVVALAAWAWGNDAAMAGQGGRVRLLKGEHASIQMVREWVRMEAGKDGYTVAAKFMFKNHGGATTVEMGFPESGGGDGVGEGYRTKTAFKEFRTWVGGVITPARRMPAKVNNGAYDTYWVKRVPFAAGQTRSVRVEYAAPYGSDTEGFLNAGYDFTGGNWKGKVERSEVEVVVSRPGVHWATAWPGLSAAKGANGRGTRFSGAWTNWEAECSVSLGLLPVERATLMPAGQARSVRVDNGGSTPGISARGPVTLVGGRAFVAPADNRHLEDTLQEAGTQMALSWRAATGITTISAGGREIVVKAGSREATVNGTKVTLDAAPFVAMSMRNGYTARPRLFVPMRALVEALGGSVEVDVKAMTYRMTFPKATATARG